MCQRKIIRPNSETIVPLFNGCDCPMIKEFHHIHVDDQSATTDQPISINQNQKRKSKPKQYSMPPGCYDIHTQLPAAEGHHVVFRHCDCHHPTGVCMKLPPLLYQISPAFEQAYLEDSQDDDETDDWDGTIGLRPPL